MQLTPKEKRDLKIALPIVVVAWAAFLILTRPIARTQHGEPGPLKLTPLMIVIGLTLVFYFQHRDEAAFPRLFRRQIFWSAAFGSPLWMVLRASQQVYWYDTLTWRPLIEGLMLGATSIVLGWFLLRRAAQRTRGREQSEDSV